MPLRRSLASEDGTLPPTASTQSVRTLAPDDFDRMKELLERPAAPDHALRALVAQDQAGGKDEGGAKK